VAGLGRAGYRRYFFEISEKDMIAFFEWNEVENIPENYYQTPTPINGISALTKLLSAALFSTPLRSRKTQKIVSNLLIDQRVIYPGEGKILEEN
jgi:hypothetical protein